MRLIILFSCSILAVTVLKAQPDSIDVDCAIRQRGIYDHGYKSFLPDRQSAYLSVSQRTRLGISYRSKTVESCFSIQDVRFWGDDNVYSASRSSANSESVSLFQAFILLETGKKTSLKVGRQIISRDDQRILSARNWNDYQQTYDAVLFQFRHKMLLLEAAGSWNTFGIRNDFYPKEKIRSLNFMRIKREAGNLSTSVISIYSAAAFKDSSTTLCFLATHGLNTSYVMKSFRLTASAYYQHDIANSGQAVSAYCIASQLSYACSDMLKFKAAFDVVSGNKNSNSRIQRRFNSLYGRRHAFFGAMDYFNKTPDEGLLDNYLIAEGEWNNYALNIACHRLMLMKQNLNNLSGEKVNKLLGHEIDISQRVNVQMDLVIKTGFSILFATDTLKKVKQETCKSKHNPWFLFIMVEYHPTIKLAVNK